MAAGSMTWTENKIGYIKMLKVVWTAGTGDDAGGVSDTSSNAYSGQILAVATVPGDGVTLTQPDNNYDIDLVDSDGVLNLAMDNLDNRSDTNTEFVLEMSSGSNQFLPLANSTLGISIANAGAGGQGIIYIWIK